jgi:hypothetical protein
VPAMPSFTYDALRINEDQRFTDMSRSHGERGGSFIDKTVVLEELGRGTPSAPS